MTTPKRIWLNRKIIIKKKNYQIVQEGFCDESWRLWSQYRLRSRSIYYGCCWGRLCLRRCRLMNCWAMVSAWVYSPKPNAPTWMKSALSAPHSSQYFLIYCPSSGGLYEPLQTWFKIKCQFNIWRKNFKIKIIFLCYLFV